MSRTTLANPMGQAGAARTKPLPPEQQAQYDRFIDRAIAVLDRDGSAGEFWARLEIANAYAGRMRDGED